MRYIKLTEEQELKIRDLYENSSKNNVRERAQALLLSHEGYARKDIASILKKRNDTIPDWYNRIEAEPNWNLEDKKGRGRKPILDKEKKKSIFFRKESSLS